MKKSITFFASLVLAISLNAAEITITPAESIATTYTNAAADDVIILDDGIYTIDATISLTKGITIKAKNPLKATVIGSGFIFNTSGITDVKIEGIIFDGTKAIDGVKQLYFSDINGASTLNNFSIEGCKIINYGNCLLRANRAEAVCVDIKVNNCIIQNNGYSNAYPLFQMTKTKVTRLEFTNNTVIDFANEYIQFYGTVGGNNDAVLLFKNNTFFNTVTNSARRPMSGKSGKLYVQKNIFVKSPVHTPGEISFDAAVTTIELTDNVINDFAGGAFLSAPGWLVNTGNSDIYPEFKDSLNNDFTLPVGSSLITANIGDPRWFVGPTSTKSTKQNSISVYPNPTTDKIYFGRVFASLEVSNMLGQKLITSKNTDNLVLGHLTNGNYIVRVTDEQGEVSISKILKK